MTTQAKDRAYQIFYLSDLIGVRVIMALAEIIFGVTALLPGESFQRSKTYSGLAQIATEETWGIILLISGCLQFWIVYEEAYHSRAAVWFACVNSVLWWLITISLFVNVWPANLVAAADAGICFAASWVFMRSGFIPYLRRGEGKTCQKLE